MQKERGISGYVLSRNCLSLDYCIDLTIRSLLPVCNEVVVCDAGSTDGTLEMLEEWAGYDSKLRITHWDWPDPKGETYFFVKWINHAREQLRYDMQLNIEADECLSLRSHDAIREAAAERGSRMFRRLNFWRDACSLAPDGHYCGHQVVRMGPQELWMPSDAPDPHGPQDITRLATWDDRLEIFHYGALRKPEAFIAKSKVMQGAIFGSLDSRLADAEKAGDNWVDRCPFPKPLQRFRGKHPDFALQWLRDRGHSP
jgi:glycosyltransferase involved in cell wall biosynthesis